MVEAIMTSAARTVAIARAIHRFLIVLAPRAVRQTYRDEMIATFAAASADAGQRGALAVLALLLREVRDLIFARRANRPAGIDVSSLGTSAALPPRREWTRGAAWTQGWRSLRRRPAFFLAATATLAFGTGITTAVFSLVDTVVIKPLPFPDADDLVTVYESSPSSRERTSLVAPVRIDDWHRLNRTFVAISAHYNENVTDTSGSQPERLESRRVNPRFFDVYRMPPLLGRTFVDIEDQYNGPGAAVISEGLWTRRFQRHPSAIGHVLQIGGKPYPIVGVMPAIFTQATTDVWLPAKHDPYLKTLRDARFLQGIGRLKPGVSIEDAARDLAAVQAALGREFPKTDAKWSAEIGPLKTYRMRAVRRGLTFVFFAVIALWVIAIANIAGLTLVQVHRRTRELAIRTALGASRARVIGTLVREGVLVALIGGTAGALLAWWFVTMMRTALAQTPRVNELTLDWRSLAFAIATSFVAAILFSIIPALSATRSRVNQMIGGSRGVIGGRHGLQKALVVAQVAVSVLLVGSATLLVRSYHNLTQIDTGFDASSVVTFHVGARWDEDRTRIGLMQMELLTKLEELPHVQAAGMTNFLPATGATLRYQIAVDGLTGPNQDGSMTIGVRTISGGYLRALKAPLLSGDWCPFRAPGTKGPRTAMINRRFLDVYAPGEQLVGRTFRQIGIPGAAAGIIITGVIGNLVEDGHATTVAPYVYFCETPGYWPDPEYVARTSDPGTFATDLRRIVRELDASRAIFGVKPLQQVLDASLDQPRLDATMLGLFAMAAVTLAAIGLYSLFMLVVSERAREMAVRLAIGAAPAELIRLVMTGAGRLLAGGIIVGVGLTAAADRLLRGVLFGVSPLDATALAAAAGTLAALLAVVGPALKASRIAPVEALRGE
jgi:putative ABC transport system permease protein